MFCYEYTKDLVYSYKNNHNKNKILSFLSRTFYLMMTPSSFLEVPRCLGKQQLIYAYTHLYAYSNTSRYPFFMCFGWLGDDGFVRA